MKFLASCTNGLEDVSPNELKNLGAKMLEIRDSKVEFEASKKFIYKAHLLARTINRFWISIYKGKFKDLSDIKKDCFRIDWSKWLDSKMTFGVKTDRVGIHKFCSIDVNALIGNIIRKHFDNKIKVNLSDPDVEIKCWIRNNVIEIGINLTGESLHKRWYRIEGHPAPLKPTTAAALVLISKWKRNQILWDPFCGSGTIPIEAGLYITQAPITRRSDFKFLKFDFFDEDAFKKTKEKFERKNVEYKIFGSDIVEKYIEIAKKAKRRARVNIKLFKADARSRKVYEKIQPNVIISNLPYGIRLSERKYLYGLFDRFLYLSKDYAKKIIVLWLKGSLNKISQKFNYEVTESRRLLIGDIRVKMSILEKF